MAYKCDDTFGALDLPDLDGLISTTACQIVSDGARRSFLGCRTATAPAAFCLFLLLVAAPIGFMPSLLRSSLHLQVLFHLLDPFLSR